MSDNAAFDIMPKRRYAYWLGISLFCVLIIAFFLYLRGGGPSYAPPEDMPFYISSPDAPKLIRAAAFGDTREVKRLIEKGALLDEEIFGWTALHAAVWYGHANAARALIEAKASLDLTNAEGLTALGSAISKKNIAITKMLLDAGAAMDAGAGASPLLLAAQKGNIPLVDLLLRHGADIAARDQAGNDALLCAAFRGHIDLYDYLAARGMLPNTRNTQGMSALMLAAEGRRIAMLGRLLNKLPDGELNAADTAGRSALHWAVIGGHPAAVSVLLDAGIDAQLRARDGRTARALARDGQSLMLYEIMAARE